jgi:spore maturation protein CgeB
MKIILFWSYYNKYLEQLYQSNSSLSNLSYKEQQNYILSDYFGWPPALVRRIGEKGHEVEILIVNSRPLQQAWAKENSCKFDDRNWEYDIPLQQVKQFQPDIIWMGSMFQYFGEYLDQLKVYCRKIFAWIAYPPPSSLNLSAVDCILTSHTNFQEYFTGLGKPCEIVLPTFEPRILEYCPEVDRDIECSFIGSLSYGHLQRMNTLKQLVTQTPLQIWSSLPRLLSKGLLQPKFIQSYMSMGIVRKRMNNSVWGMDMYRIFRRSQITINVHLDAAAGLAGNMRMFEATGMGALLITENAPNIRKLYEPGKEVIVYENISDLVNVIKYYIDEPQQVEVIAKAGQYRTLNEHSPERRSQELIQIFSKYLDQ